MNSEGSLLKVSVEKSGVIIIEAYSRLYNGDLSFQPKFKDFVSYIESKLTLRELITLSNWNMFSFDVGVEMKRIPLEEVINSILYVDCYFKNVPENLK